MKIWFSYDEVMKALGTWVTPEVPYWYNTKKWNNRMRNEHVKKDNSEKSDNDQKKKREDPRKGHKHQYRSNDPRRGEPELNYYPEEYYHRESHSYSHDPRFHSDFDEDYDIPLSGVGRTSGPSYPPRRERNTNPGYDQRGRSTSRDDYDARHREGRYEDRSHSRERRRGTGAARAKKFGYGKSGRS